MKRRDTIQCQKERYFVKRRNTLSSGTDTMAQCIHEQPKMTFKKSTNVIDCPQGRDPCEKLQVQEKATWYELSEKQERDQANVSSSSPCQIRPGNDIEGVPNLKAPRILVTHEEAGDRTREGEYNKGW